MKKTLIWDLPTRLIHWAFAGSVTAAFVIAFTIDDDSPLFQLHMVFGIIAAFLVAVRMILGVIGSRHARFENFPLNPVGTARYLAGVVSGKARTFAGNNPGSAWAAVAMLTLVPLLVFTGIGSDGEAFEDLHEVFAYALLTVIGAHLAGLLIHFLRHRENPAMTMITGRKAAPAAEGISSAHGGWGLALLGVAASWILALFASHDSAAGTVRLPVVNQVVKLGENEGDEDRSRGRRESRGHEDDDDRE